MIIQTDEIVTRAGARDLNLDVFRPPAPGKRTAVILLHGGGWSRGHRSAMHGYASILAAKGFTAIAAEYRLTGEAAWPAQILDVYDVIAWASTHAAQLDIDPQQIVMQGYSAGGHLALLAAGTAGQHIFRPEPAPAGIAAVVSFFAPPMMTKDVFPVRPPPLRDLLGPDGNEDAAIAASPLTYVSSRFPPVFLLSGMRDPFMPYQLTLRLFDALTASGAKAELHLFHDQNHEFAALPSLLEPVQAEVALFLDRAVANPEFYRQEDLTFNIFSQPGGPEGREG